MTTRRRRRRWKGFTRDSILFTVGILGVLHETLFQSVVRTDLLVVFGAMMGLPAFLQLDAKNNGAGEKDDSPDDTQPETPEYTRAQLLQMLVDEELRVKKGKRK